jgi:(S)-2-hydroxyglutarate dehydrogenase
VDAIIVGAGAVGLSTAWHLAQAGVRTVVLEKEAAPGRHQSTRNSGVIHAGYNLKPGSQKARFCIEGSRRLRAHCLEHGVAMHQNGILVVAQDAQEEATLAELRRRAQANGVEANLLDAAGLRDVEPHAAGTAALHAPEGASFDAEAYVASLAHLATQAGADIRYGVRVRGARPNGRAGVVLAPSAGPLRAAVWVNAAGLHADRLAAKLAPDMRIIPFRGYYAELREPRRSLVRSHIYATPNLAMPFLGVHLSRRSDGRVIVGPGAMLAFGREAYHLLGVQPRDLAATLSWPGFWRLWQQPGFAGLVGREVAKSMRLKAIWREAARLVPALQSADLVRAYAGNRAQMVDRQGRLVEDMVVRTTDDAVHVLNAVSPGLTASLPFGEHLAELAAARMG